MEFWNVTRKGKIKGLGISMKRNSQKKRLNEEIRTQHSAFYKINFCF